MTPKLTCVRLIQLKHMPGWIVHRWEYWESMLKTQDIRYNWRWWKAGWEFSWNHVVASWSSDTTTWPMCQECALVFVINKWGELQFKNIVCTCPLQWWISSNPRTSFSKMAPTSFRYVGQQICAHTFSESATSAFKYPLFTPQERPWVCCRCLQGNVLYAPQRGDRRSHQETHQSPGGHLCSRMGIFLDFPIWTMSLHAEKQMYRVILMSNPSHRVHLHTTSFLLALLRISTLWDIQTVHNFMAVELVQKAEKHDSDFPLFLWLHIGVQFSMEQLIHLSFHTLARQDCLASGMFHVVDSSELQLELIDLIILARSMLESKCCHLATVPPPIQHDSSCVSRERCKELWEFAWVF